MHKNYKYDVIKRTISWSRFSSGIALKIISRDKIAAANEEICVAARGCETTKLTFFIISNESIFFLYINALHLLYEVCSITLPPPTPPHSKYVMNGRNLI